MNELRFGFNVPHTVRDVAACAREIESLGYDFFGIPEHLMMGNPPRPGILAIPALAAAAGATTKIRLLSSVLILPIYHPVMLAKLATTLDVISCGRYIFGAGIGGESVHEFRAVEVPVKQRGSRANESLEIIKKLWTEDHVSFAGRHYTVDDITLNPKPDQQPHPPIWVAGRHEPAMRRAALLGNGWLPYLYDPERYRASVETITRIAGEAGKPLDGFAWGFHQHVLLRDTKERAMEDAVASFGYTSSRDHAAVIRDYWAVGTAKDAIETLERIVDAGAREISIITPGGDIPGVMDQARRIAAEVIPHFR
jgi:probable F420-dependent oxidoreductase